MQVGIVVHSLSHNNIGRVYPFLQAFVGTPDIRCRLIGWDTGGLFPLLNDLPWPITRLRSGYTPEQLAAALQGCDLVHCFKSQAHLPATVAAARQLGLPLVLDLDDWELGLYLEGVTRWPAWRRALWGLPFSARIRAELGREQLARTAPAARTVNSRALQGHFGGEIVYTAADAQAFAPEHSDGASFRQQHGIAFDAPLVGFLGTPHPHKGIDELLAAFAQLRGRHPAARLLFAGVPPRNPYAKQLRATPGVVSTGYLPASAYPAAYAACDIVAIPQRAVTEGVMQTPAKLILAMAAGRPIVATTVGDMPLILDGTGVLVPPEDSHALAAALASLIDDPAARRALGDAARQRFLAHYTTSHMREQLMGIYRAAIDI
ncbi:MAG: glycosyltransferase family 4 protein [Roseiflexaceae bacterium]|nr:glycosyltransferase family 4 protein [Roseiflexaceae bacterium]